MLTTVHNPFVQHMLEVTFDLANNAGRLIQRIADTRESAQPRDDSFQRLVRNAQISFDQLVDDADQYILAVKESGNAPLDYRSLEGLAERLRTMEREVKRLMKKSGSQVIEAAQEPSPGAPHRAGRRVSGRISHPELDSALMHCSITDRTERGFHTRFAEPVHISPKKRSSPATHRKASPQYRQPKRKHHHPTVMGQECLRQPEIDVGH
ncbi:hypothetical protein VRRI112168_07235 [Vreelandella rituensis]